MIKYTAYSKNILDISYSNAKYCVQCTRTVKQHQIQIKSQASYLCHVFNPYKPVEVTNY